MLKNVSVWKLQHLYAGTFFINNNKIYKKEKSQRHSSYGGNSAEGAPAKKFTAKKKYDILLK